MELTQSGRTVDGFMWLAGELVERPLQGEIDDLGRFAWVVPKDCKIYSGLLNHEAGGQELNGTIIIDESNCAVNNSTSGTLKLTRFKSWGAESAAKLPNLSSSGGRQRAGGRHCPRRVPAVMCLAPGERRSKSFGRPIDEGDHPSRPS